MSSDYAKRSEVLLNNVMGAEEKNTKNMNETPAYVMTAPNLLALPDDVLLVIMSYLGPVDLLSIAQLSERLEGLSQDRTLWTVVDTRPHRMTLPELTTVVEQLRPTTRMLAARGFVADLPARLTASTETVCFSPELLSKICSQCPALDTLILEEQYAEIQQNKKANSPMQIRLKLFPKTLTTLSLKGCEFHIRKHQESFFHDINVHLPLLKVLILSGCSWVYPHDFIPIGKCNKLEELRMDGCHRLGECVAYTSLAARFGFPSLKILDLRDTNMGDSDVTCFNRTTSLTHLYLECPTDPKHHMNNLSGCYDTRYGWTQYVFPQGSPIIIINRLGQSTDRCVERLQSQRDNDEDNRTCEGAKETAGPSCSSEENEPKQNKCCKKLGDRPALRPLTRSVSSLCVNSPGPSTCTEKRNCIQKRKSEPTSGSSKRIKRDTENGHSEEEPTGTASEHQAEGDSGPSGFTNIQNEENSDNSSDWSSDDSDNDSVVYELIRGKKYVRKLPKNQQCHGQQETNCGVIPAPEPIISDLCVMSFAEGATVQNQNGAAGGGMGRNVVSGSNLWYVRLMYPEMIGGRPNLHTLVLRNFSRITDQSLHLLVELSSLRYLDVSGTSVTERAVLDFKLRRPEVEIVSDFDVPF